jgi:DNA topoisomerase III
MKLFIAEKPSQARDIANVLNCRIKNEGYLSDSSNSTVITWCYGHLLGPANPDGYDAKYKSWRLDLLPIIPDTWKYVSNPNTAKQLKVIKNLLKDATEVVISTDADREGELIGRLILNHAKYKGSIKRLWLSALDDKSIRKALNEVKEGSETEPLYYAGLSRQRADWMAGINFTRACSNIFGGIGNVYSVGRVQTPTLNMIVKRDLEIENFISKPYYTIKALFKNSKALELLTDWIVSDDLKGDDEGRCLKKDPALHVVEKCLGKDGFVKEYKVTKKKKAAPLPFSLSDLQKKANTKYGLSADSTLKIAQSLYEKYKLTTYPRSDCNYLPNSQFEEVKEIFNSLFNLDNSMQSLLDKCNPSYKSKCWNDKKVNESSHHAIIPTSNDKVNLSSMNDMERKVYDLVVKQYLSQFMGDFVYNQTSVLIECEDEGFKASGISPIEHGWKLAFSKEEPKKNEQEQLIPTLEKNETVNCSDINFEEKETKPPARYTEATLLSAMKNAGRSIDDKDMKKILAEVQGLGTEATRASIIETLKSRAYITVEKRKYLISTDKGRSLITQIPESLKSVEITAKWEEKLNLIAKKKYDYKTFLDQQIDNVKNQLQDLLKLKLTVKKDAKSVINACSECGNELIRRKSKKGKGFWWGCSNWQNGCKVVMDDLNGKPIAKKAYVKQNLSDYNCPKCKKNKLVKRNGKNGVFWGCSGFPKCKATFFDNLGKPRI